MERPLVTKGIILNLVSGYFKAMVRAFSIVLTITLIHNVGQTQVNCNTILACSDGVQISLDDDCNMIINPYMMMPAYTYHADSFDVEAALPNGTLLPQFTIGFDTKNRPIRRVSINRSHIGMNLKVKVSLRGCSNACWGHAKIEDKLPPVISDCPCEERLTFLRGTLVDSDPIYNRPSSEVGCMAGPTPVFYKTQNMAVSATGIVDISLPNPSVRFSIYSSPFNPASPCTNIIVSNTNSFSGSLTQGVQYVLVISSAGGAVPSGGIIYEAFIDSRVGDVQSSPTSTVCVSECGSESTILAQTAITATNRPTFLDGCSGANWVPTTNFNGTINFNGSSITLSGGNNMGAGPAIGAQICFTTPVAQTITFDWATTLAPNTLTDSVYYTINNGTRVALSNGPLSGTNVAVNLSAGQTICFRVATDNVAPENILTLTNVRVTPGFPNLTYAKTDSVTILPCYGRFGKIIRRQWTATDPSGNVSEVKTQYFYIRRGTIETITCPANWIRDCSVSFTKLPSGAPDPISSGSPGGISCDNIQVFYDDILFDLCGAGIKVRRQWTIIDWCTGRDTICNQEIKIEDNTAPTLTCPVLSPIKTNDHNCYANWRVTPPNPTDCSSMSWDVLFSKDSIAFIKSDGVTSINTSAPVYLSNISTDTNRYVIANLPLGKTWIKYIVRDTCGNFRECNTSIIVEDRTPPTAICEDETIVSIDDTGWGVLKATSLDNHSIDNCTDDLRFEIKRKDKFCAGYPQDTTFRNEVRFCCSDAALPVSYHIVVLRVYDKAGNFNECESTVKVQNKRPASIVCPSPKTLTCGDAKIAAWISGTLPFDTTFFGVPSVSGVCAQLQVASRIKSNNINPKCNSGTVTREWYLVSNPNVKCDQVLTISSPVFNSSSVVFPNDTTLTTCDLAKATPDFLNSKPIVDKLACRDIGVSFIDQVFRDVPGACIKIIRTWKVIDWCSYNQTPFIAENSQKILLTGTGPVTFIGCSNRTITASSGRCDTLVTLSVTPNDDCTDEEDWKYSWTLDLYKDNVNDDAGTTQSTRQNLPVGTHRINFTVTNICGTQTTCGYDITILANKAPTPVCYNELVWVMDPSGSTEIWANDFIQSTSTNICGTVSSFDYYVFRRDDNNITFTTTRTGMRFNCAQDIPNGQVARIPLKVYVRDRNTGLFDFCNVTLILQDSPLTDACEDRPNLLPAISGKITTDRNEGVEEIEVSLKNMKSSSEIKSMTKQNGEYKLEGVDVFDPKSIGAYKNNDVLNGVSTLDLVMIQRHILGLQKIESPYKLLAADVNNSRSITAGDLVSLRKLVLGVTNEFDNNTSWRFVPTSYEFSDPNNPFDYPFKVNLDSLYEDKDNVNFTAVKVGDVNGSVVVNAKSTEFRSGNTLFTADQFNFAQGDVIKYEVRAGDDMNVLGTQFGIEFNANQLLFTGVSGGAFDIKSHHYNPFHVSNGKLSFSYDVAEGKALKAEEVLFTIEFKALLSGNTQNIRLDHSTIKPEVYEADGSIHNLFIQSRDKNINSSQNILYQNEPNPFKESTNISFELAKGEFVKLRVLDLTGKLVYTQSGNFEKGFHSININNVQIGNTGVYYYQIEAGEFTATKKMILIE